ncbi:MAG: hypothetical protein L0Y42_14555, partial [Phycisphaerales bacterium]|nr:hypothetical protein [Phycisphaerales bacterium]
MALIEPTSDSIDYKQVAQQLVDRTAQMDSGTVTFRLYNFATNDASWQQLRSLLIASQGAEGAPIVTNVDEWLNDLEPSPKDSWNGNIVYDNIGWCFRRERMPLTPGDTPDLEAPPGTTVVPLMQSEQIEANAAENLRLLDRRTLIRRPP